MRFKLLLCILVYCCPMAAHAQNAWETATQAYETGQYDAAIAAYKSLLDEGVHNGELHYNLGNAYYQAGEIAQAILHYERASRYMPADADIRNNLVLANARRENAVIPVSSFFLYRWIKTIAGLLTVPAWGVVSLLLLWTTIALLCRMIWAEPGKTLRRLAIVCGILTLSAIAFGAVRLHDLRSDAYAIAMPLRTNVYVAPDAESKVNVEITGGEKVRILDSLDGFYKVRLPNFEDGWVDAEMVERI